MRAVEHADAPAAGRVEVNAPQKIVVQLLGAWRLKRRHFHPGRVHSREQVANSTVFATRVDGLKYQQQALPVLGVEVFLVIAQLLAQFG